eukprot:874443-Rhodomonas_salina.1
MSSLAFCHSVTSCIPESRDVNKIEGHQVPFWSFCGRFFWRLSWLYPPCSERGEEEPDSLPGTSTKGRGLGSMSAQSDDGEEQRRQGAAPSVGGAVGGAAPLLIHPPRPLVSAPALHPSFPDLQHIGGQAGVGLRKSPQAT